MDTVGKRLALLGTGGTIAGSAAQRDDIQGYTPATLTIQQLLDTLSQTALPVSAMLPIITEQVFQIGSEEMTPVHWQKLAQRVQYWIEQDDIAGVVVTHGTDTLEETAWFLQLTQATHKPIVLVGAMLPATAPHADGPLNLAQAVLVAASTEAQQRGVLVVMHGKVFAAHDVTKRFTDGIDAFTAGQASPLGFIEEGRLHFNAEPSRVRCVPFTVSASLPVVEIVYGYASTSRVAVDALVQSGVQGIVYAAPGSGTLSGTLRAALRDAAAQGVVVVRASRTGAGQVRAQTHDDQDARLFVSANTLNPQKARVLLLLALQQTSEIQQIQALFDALG